MSRPLEVLGIDHVGPFPVSASKHRYLLVLVDYFSHSLWAFPTRSTRATEAVKLVRQWRSWVLFTPLAFYADPGSTFRSAEFQTALKRDGILVINSLSQSALDWDEGMQDIMTTVNGRVMQSVGYSPSEILFGIGLSASLERSYPTFETTKLKATLENDGQWAHADDEVHADLVTGWVALLEEVRDDISLAQRETNAARLAQHRLRSLPPYKPGKWIMVVQEGKPPKLTPRWRGPFMISRQIGRASSESMNIDGSSISLGKPLEFHEDQLKPFQPRTGYLAGDWDASIPGRQPLRRPRRAGL